MSDPHRDAQHARIVALEATVDRLRGLIAAVVDAYENGIEVDCPRPAPPAPAGRRGDPGACLVRLDPGAMVFRDRAIHLELVLALEQAAGARSSSPAVALAMGPGCRTSPENDGARLRIRTVA